jgi:hypothetical protein
MKLKTTYSALFFSIGSAIMANAATFLVTNVNAGAGDTIYASSANVPLSSGYSAIGYFTSVVQESDIDTISELQSQLTLGTFTTVAFADDFTGGGIGAGYVNGAPVDVGSITGANPLLADGGRTIYVITTNQSSLASFASGSGENNQVALVNFGTILNDVPSLQLYNGNPVSPATIVIGGSGVYEETEGGYLGDGIYNTLILAAIPEPSTLILSALGVLGLLRRRR